MHCFPHTGCPSTNRILPTGQDLPHIPQEIQPSSTWKLLVPMTKRTNKGFTTYVFSQAALPSCTFQTLFRAMTSSAIEATACRAFSSLLTAKAPHRPIEHRYVGIGHCNRPGSIQRKMFRQAVHSLSHIVPACTHGITVTAVRQPELRQKINQDTGCIP